jgi:DNA-binding NarL/FixJ family response regulator
MAEKQAVVAPAKVLVIDDHPAVREGLALRISQHDDLQVCGEAEDVAEALRLSSELDPDIIITDISLKKSDGIDLIKRIKARNPNARILVWSMHSESLYADRALRAGAMGYITKEHATEQIIDAVRQVLAGNLYLSPAMRERLLSRVAGGALTQAATTVDELTDRELQVYRLIGKGVKTQEIAEQLHLSVKTVETYRDRIKKKLELKDATELIRSAALWSTQNA